MWCAGDVQHDDRFIVHQYLVGAESESAYILVLHHQFLSLPDGDLPIERFGVGVVVVLYFRDSRVGGFERAGESVGPAFRLSLSELGVGVCRLCNRGGGGQFARQPLDLEQGPTGLSKCE